ncbi:hypothetical protein CSAL01_09570 [Colletotrichum salicis]|uniref:BTB domain-containing protein n=1 Tax=Colletotrichum salicis TaxID=1209931 RepID=A0A135UGL5_9PEZI|nr:hypothetical protein CSAL01_09570 [Colletotrichum salicis]
MANVDLSSLYSSTRYSDLTIEASGELFHCHRCIVFTQCEAWEKMLLRNGRLVLAGAYITKTILNYMYTGKYKPFNVPCFTDKPEVLETNAEGTIDERSYSEHSMIFTAVVLARATALKITTLYEQAKAELLKIAPTYTQHADFIETIKYVLQTQPYEEALQIVVRMIKTRYESRIACVLLEEATGELYAIKRERSLTHQRDKTEPGQLGGGYGQPPAAPGMGSTRSTPLQVVSATSAKRKGADGEMPATKRIRESIE